MVGDGDRFVAGLNEWQIDYNDPLAGQNQTGDQIGGDFVTLTAVPEARSFALSLGGAVWLLCCFRRRSPLSRRA